MNVDISIHRLGARHSRSLTVAFAQVVQLRQSLELTLQHQTGDTRPSGARLASAVEGLRARADLDPIAPRHQLDVRA